MPRYSGPIIDAHHHLWQLADGRYPWLDAPGREALRQDFGVDDYTETFAGRTIAGSVWVEALAADPEAELAAAERIRRGTSGICAALVAHAPLDAPDIAARLDRLMAISPALRGIRDIVAPGFARRSDLLVSAAFGGGLQALAERNLVFDLMLGPAQGDAAATMLAEVPEVVVAIEHAGNPSDRSASGMASWRRGMEALARRPNTVVKVSALQVVDPEWTLASLAAIVEPLRTAFGVERMCWGTDWPVHDLACPGPVALDAALDLTADWPADAQAQFFAGTARRLYRMENLP